MKAILVATVYWEKAQHVALNCLNLVAVQQGHHHPNHHQHQQKKKQETEFSHVYRLQQIVLTYKANWCFKFQSMKKNMLRTAKLGIISPNMGVEHKLSLCCFNTPNWNTARKNLYQQAISRDSFHRNHQPYPPPASSPPET